MRVTANLHAREEDRPSWRDFFDGKDGLAPWVSIKFTEVGQDLGLICSDPAYLDALADTCREAATAMRQAQRAAHAVADLNRQIAQRVEVTD
jgi:hypothetical protein